MNKTYRILLVLFLASCQLASNKEGHSQEGYPVSVEYKNVTPEEFASRFGFELKDPSLYLSRYTEVSIQNNSEKPIYISNRSEFRKLAIDPTEMYSSKGLIVRFNDDFGEFRVTPITKGETESFMLIEQFYGKEVDSAEVTIRIYEDSAREKSFLIKRMVKNILE